jgi:hypothetical protein
MKANKLLQESGLALLSGVQISDVEKIQTTQSLVRLGIFLYYWLIGLFLSYTVKALFPPLAMLDILDGIFVIRGMNITALVLEFVPYVFGILTGQLELSFHFIHLLSLLHLFGMSLNFWSHSYAAHLRLLVFLSMIEAGFISWTLNHSVINAITDGFWSYIYILAQVYRSGGVLELAVRLSNQ